MKRALLLAASSLLAGVLAPEGVAASEVSPAQVAPGSSPRGVDMVTGKGRVCDAVRARLANNDRAYADVADADGLVWRDVWADAGALIPEWNRATAISEAVFDFDNDSRADRVTVFSYFGSYMKGSVVLVALGNSMPKIEHGTSIARDEDFKNPRYWFLPCQWDAQAIATPQCPGFSQEFDEASFAMPLRGSAQGIEFRARYSRLVPVHVEKHSYVVVTAMDDGASGYVAVIKPLPHKKFKRMCLLRIPAEAEGPDAESAR